MSGAAVLVDAVVLYVSGARRAGAVWITPVGAAAVLPGFVSLRAARVSRRAGAAVALVALGVAPWVYSETTGPSTITPVIQRPTPVRLAVM